MSQKPKLLLAALAITLLMALAGWLVGSLGQPSSSPTSASPANPEKSASSQNLLADLKADWSNSANPNPKPAGTWSFNHDATPLAPIASWSAMPGIPGWGNPANSPGQWLPFIYQAPADGTPGDPNGYDFKAGDILLHSNDPTNGPQSGQAIIAWTSNTTGTLSVSGALWPVRRIARENAWQLQLLSDAPTKTLAAGILPEDGSLSRANPAPITAADIPIKKGDSLHLIISRTPNSVGDFTAVNLSLTATPAAASISPFRTQSPATPPAANHPLAQSTRNYALPAFILSLLAFLIASISLAITLILLRQRRIESKI